jgi:hypothetical protein
MASYTAATVFAMTGAPGNSKQNWGLPCFVVMAVVRRKMASVLKEMRTKMCWFYRTQRLWRTAAENSHLYWLKKTWWRSATINQWYDLVSYVGPCYSGPGDELNETIMHAKTVTLSRRQRLAAEISAATCRAKMLLLVSLRRRKMACSADVSYLPVEMCMLIHRYVNMLTTTL